MTLLQSAAAVRIRIRRIMDHSCDRANRYIWASCCDFCVNFVAKTMRNLNLFETSRKWRYEIFFVSAASWFHACGIAGSDCHHRDSDWDAVAGGTERS